MPFVPEDFQIPATLLHPLFRLRMLRAADAQADYEAVMASQARLRAGSPHGWPRPGFTLAENMADLERHEREFHDRVAFAYTVLTPDESTVVGCVYINPCSLAETDPALMADVYLWVRDEHHPLLTRVLFEAVGEWLASRWPFERVRYVRTEYYLEGD
ncbi:MAG TPA: hypothetical protein VIS76_01710 [Pseudomonadales bacterium]